MPEAKVYLCDKLEGLPEPTGKRASPHKKCGKEVGGDGVLLTLAISPVQAELAEEPGTGTLVLKFCGRSHAQYWLIRQRLASVEPEAE